jgi:tetratricopeptide (TPR) repeat protein
MKRIRALVLAYCAAVLLAPILTGCFPGGENHLDEEKDPHFQRGRNLSSGQDFKGAAEEFERALETNPRSAAAHFELGWLYDTKLNDYAGAIYHYQRHLQLQPDSERAQLVNERIRGCKQQLANAEFPLPNSQNLQREVDRLTVENTRLKQEVDSLHNQLGAANAMAARALAAAPNAAQVSAVRAERVAPPATRLLTAAAIPAPAAISAPSRRVHVIREHETISSIAAHYGIRAAALLAANPRVEPRHLRVGQSLNIP